VISSIFGTITDASGTHVVLEVGGIGYLISVPERTARDVRLRDELQLHTSLVIRDDSVNIFGFESKQELELFSLLRGVNGVGPKMALAILGQLTPSSIRDAVVGEDDTAFRAVSGVGAKTAKQIVLSLQGSFDSNVGFALATNVNSRDKTSRESVIEALIGLGWTERAARGAVNEVVKSQGETQADVASLLRDTLTYLGPGPKRESRT